MREKAIGEFSEVELDRVAGGGTAIVSIPQAATGAGAGVKYAPDGWHPWGRGIRFPRTHGSL